MQPRKKTRLKKGERSASGFSDQRSEFKAQTDLKQLVNTSKNSESLKSVQRMANSAASSFGQIPIQLAEKNPVYTGTTKAVKVTLNLDAGDHVKQGSAPAEDCDGYDDLRKIGLSDSSNTNPHKWVRFHALNEHSGGPGKKENLTSTTAMANHHKDWTAFETKLKAAVPDSGNAAASKVDFSVSIGYPVSASSSWVNDTDASKTQSTDAQNYPNSVSGDLDVAGTKSSVSLDASKGVYGPEKFKKVKDWTRIDPSTNAKFPTTTDWDQ